MRSSLELLELPYTFTQLLLISAEKFSSLARDRGVSLDPWRLEAVHQLGLLVPLFRAKRPTREITALLRRDGRGDEHRAHVLARWEPLRRDTLLEGLREGLVSDPGAERFQSRHS